MDGLQQFPSRPVSRLRTVSITSIVMVTWTVSVKFVVMVMDNCDGQLSTVSVKFIVMVMDSLQQFSLSSLSRRWTDSNSFRRVHCHVDERIPTVSNSFRRVHCLRCNTFFFLFFFLSFFLFLFSFNRLTEWLIIRNDRFVDTARIARAYNCHEKKTNNQTMTADFDDKTHTLAQSLCLN